MRLEEGTMLHTLRRRGLLVGLAALVLVAAGGGIAYATNGSSGDEISGCVKKPDGLLRIVQSATDCKAGETPISWPAKGTAGYRAIFSAPPAANIKVTAVGTAPIGFPGEGESATQILRFALDPGKYFVGVTLGAFKNSGNAEVLCYIRLPGDRITAFMRAALGTDPGYTRLTTVHSDGVLNDWPGGEAALVCIQDGSRPGTPTGENPQVFYATVTATNIASFETNRVP
jgi:hypothetical protein